MHEGLHMNVRFEKLFFKTFLVVFLFPIGLQAYSSVDIKSTNVQGWKKVSTELFAH